MKKNIYIFGLLSALAIITLLYLYVTSSPQKNTSDQQEKLVTASFYPLYFFSSRIAGDTMHVYNITPAGAEPHDYELSPQDRARIQDSSLLVLNGLLEPWGAKIQTSLSKNTQIVIAGKGLFENDDPHVWLDPVRADEMSAEISSAMENILPARATFYEKNEQLLSSELKQLDKDYRTGLQNCETRSFVTSHKAFGYLARRYNLEEIAIAGLSPDEEPSIQSLSQIAKYIKQNNIKYIFFESLVSPKYADTIANETGAKTLVLDPLEGISDDAQQSGTDYFTVMRQNLTNLQIALGCTPQTTAIQSSK